MCSQATNLHVAVYNALYHISLKTLHVEISDCVNFFVGEQVIVPDELVEELADLRFNFAELLHSYEKEIRNSVEAQEEFVTFLPKLFRREENLSHSLNFQSYFNWLEEKVSLFNIHYLRRLCSKFPEDVR